MAGAEEVSCEMRVLETLTCDLWRKYDLTSEFWKKSRVKCSCCRLDV